MKSDFSYLLEGQDFSTIDEVELVDAAKSGVTIFDVGTRIVRITSTAVLKIAYELLPQEALNMEYVSSHSDGQIRVPRVYRHFFWEDLGYIVMDFIDGDCLNSIPWTKRTTQERRNIVLQVTEGLACIGKLRGDTPGPLGQGVVIGGLFTLYGAGRTFQTAADMEPWFNHKLGIFNDGNITGKLQGKDLVMCHMDLSLRNLILDKTGKLWFLDWALGWLLSSRI